MIPVFILSIGIKLVSAVLEIMAQFILTRAIGVDGYGNIAFYVNAAEIAYWIFFSGFIKINTFYLPDTNIAISAFKRSYYTYYFFPIVTLIILICAFYNRAVWLITTCMLALYFLMMNQSSELLARKHSIESLFGEYLLCRIVLVFLLYISFLAGQKSLIWILCIYNLQYLVVLGWFAYRKQKKPKVQNKIEANVSIKKLMNYQKSDIALGIVTQSPVILQYLFVGAYETGVISIVVLVKKLINFVSGPTAKIFLPEFSSLYQQNHKEKLFSLFRIILRFQNLFLSVISVALLGFTKLILNLFSIDSPSYEGLFRICSLCFLFVASLGPCGGLMQMTGREKAENRMRWVTIILMGIVWCSLHENRLFALYGLCVQAIAEGILKYVSISVYFRKLPISILDFILTWSPAALICGFIWLFNLEQNFLTMTFSCCGCFFIACIILVIRWDTRQYILRTIQLWKKKRLR